VKGYVLTVERVIPAPPEVIFEFLSDAAKHHLIDGSGMLQGAKRSTRGPVQGSSANGSEHPGREPVERLALGSTFGMHMHWFVKYSTFNRVVEFEPNKRIAWKTGPDGFMGKLVAGRVWRYELVAVADGTRVRESWDITHDHQRSLLKLGDIYSGKTRRDMERTLERLSRLVGESGQNISPSTGSG
jgi:hypothetical protein